MAMDVGLRSSLLRLTSRRQDAPAEPSAEDGSPPQRSPTVSASPLAPLLGVSIASATDDVSIASARPSAVLLRLGCL